MRHGTFIARTVMLSSHQKLNRHFRNELQSMIRCLPLMLIALAWSAAGYSPSANAASSRLLEVQSETSTHVGKIVSMDGKTCYLQNRFGVIEPLPIATLKKFRVVSDYYRPAPASEIREQLLREFSNYEVAGTTHYLTCAPIGKASAYCNLFEEVFKQVQRFYRVHGFAVEQPDTTLIALVFGTEAEFREYCRKDNVAWSPGLQGYYSLTTNRVALFDQTAPALADVNRNIGNVLHSTSSLFDAGYRQFELDNDTRSMFTPSGETTNTIIHETTHQVGYNIGLHSRLGGSPTWILEGLATVLEANGVRETGSKGNGKSRINQARLDWFRQQYATRRNLGDVARMVASDDFFARNTLDAYSNAWALTYFMTDSPARTQQFVNYIRLVESRPVTEEYSTEDRLADFTKVFGDISRLESDFLRTIDRL